MDIKRIVLGFFAAAAVLIGCEPQEEDFGVAKIEVSTAALSFGPTSSSQTLQVTASREWTVSGLPDWIAVDPAGGQPSKSPQTVTVTVISNDGYDREADIAFSIGLMKEYVKVSQTGQKGQIDYGKGTLEHPFSVDGVISYINSLDNPSADSPEKVYVKGIISAVGEEYTSQYGNGTFDISDDGSTSGTQFKIYRALYLGNKKFTSKDTQIKVGDEVIVYGNVVLYGSSSPVYETSQGNAYLYSLNGVTGSTSTGGEPKGNGSKEDPFNVAAAIKAVEGLSWTSNDNYEKMGPFYVKGKISQIGKDNKTGEDLTYTQSGSYSNATFYISDDGSTDNEFYCYRVYYLGNKKYSAGQTDIKVGDEVIIYGELMNYRGNTPETVQGSAYLYSLNGDTGGGDTPTPPAGNPKGTGTQADPYNPAAAIDAVKNLTWTDNSTYDTTADVYVKGKISRIADKGTFTEGGTYGNASFYISEDGTSAGEFYCYRVLYLGNKKFESGQTDIKVGDEVVVYGQLMNYRGNTPETVAGKAYLYSLNGDTGGDTPPTPPGPGDDTASGSGTLADPYNAAGVLAYTQSLSGSDESPNDVYFKGKVSSIKYTFSAQYGTATFDVSNDGSTSGSQFTCYAVYYLENKPWVDGNTQIKVGDEVIVCGKVYKYNETTPETVSKKAYIYSLNGKTEDGGETPPTPPSGDGGTLSNPFDIAGAIAYIDGGGKDDVYVKGKVSKIVYEFDASHGTGTFWISDDGTFYEDNKKDFEAYSVKWLENKNWVDGNGQVKVGDEVILCGKLTFYASTSVYETSSKNAYVYSVNGKTENEVSGGDTPGGETGDGYKISWTGSSDWSGIGDDVISFKSGNYTITVSKEDGSTKPTVNGSSNDCRAYAKNQVKVANSSADITSLTFIISSQGKKRLTDIKASAGDVKIDKDNWKVTWIGSAKEVTFTVGEKATYGTDGDSKAGQFDFDYILAKP